MEWMRMKDKERVNGKEKAKERQVERQVIAVKRRLLKGETGEKVKRELGKGEKMDKRTDY